MDNLVVAVGAGATSGGVYALIALGFVLAFRATATFNFAHAELMIFPAFIVGSWSTAGTFPVLVAAALALMIVAAVGGLFYVLVLQRTLGMPHWMGFVASLGLASVLQGLMVLIFGTNTYSIDLPLLPDGSVEVAGAQLSQASLVLAGSSSSLGGIVVALLRFTTWGTSVRAAGQDPVLASQSGINVRAVFLASWAGAALLAGLAGLVYCSQNLVATETAAIAWAAIPAAMLGGLDSLEGVLVGGLGIGLIQGLTATYIGGAEVDLMVYSVLLVVLLLRPRGLFGTEEVTRV